MLHPAIGAAAGGQGGPALPPPLPPAGPVTSDQGPPPPQPPLPAPVTVGGVSADSSGFLMFLKAVFSVGRIPPFKAKTAGQQQSKAEPLLRLIKDVTKAGWGRQHGGFEVRNNGSVSIPGKIIMPSVTCICINSHF
jgi:hypothetical protein